MANLYLKEGNTMRFRETLSTRLMRAVVVSALTAATVIGASGTANASLSQCSSSYWCIWTGPNYNPSPSVAYTGNSSGYSINIGSYYNNGTTGRGVKEWKTNGALFTCVLPLYGYDQVSGVTGGSHQWNSAAYGGCNF
jgi:hypothetical protein